MNELAVIQRPSPNFDAREGEIDMIVLHYTGMETGAGALQRLSDAESKVSAHYVLEEDGRLHNLVRETDRAWHAGVSSWGGRALLNDCSIGIEIVNPGHEWGYRAFPEPQMDALLTLVADIKSRWSIPPERVVGHSDIAPRRKEDPGELFDWPRLASAGLAIWPEAADRATIPRILDPEGIARLSAELETVGYELDDFGKTLLAFRRRFRPTALDGPPEIHDFLIAREIANRYPAKRPVSTAPGIIDGFNPADV